MYGPYAPYSVVNWPQSTTATATFVANGAGLSLFASVLVSWSRESVKTPSIEPVFLMSTTPVFGPPPGFMLAALRIAVPSLLFSIEREPALNVLLGFAVRAVKSAPEPTAVATAMRPSASVARVRLRLPSAAPDGGAAASVAPPATPAAVAGPPAIRHARRSSLAGGPGRTGRTPPSATPSIPRHRRRNFILLPTTHLPRRRSVRRAR